MENGAGMAKEFRRVMLAFIANEITFYNGLTTMFLDMVNRFLWLNGRNLVKKGECIFA
jgi:hypothetical protein